MHALKQDTDIHTNVQLSHQSIYTNQNVSAYENDKLIGHL